MRKPIKKQATNPKTGKVEICRLYPNLFFGKDRDGVFFPGSDNEPFDPTKTYRASQIKDLCDVVEMGELAEGEVNPLIVPVTDEVFRNIERRQKFSVVLPICDEWAHLAGQADGKNVYSHVRLIVKMKGVDEVDKSAFYVLKKIDRYNARQPFEETGRIECYRVILAGKVGK